MKIKAITDLPVYLRLYGSKFLIDVYSSFLFPFDCLFVNNIGICGTSLFSSWPLTLIYPKTYRCAQYYMLVNLLFVCRYVQHFLQPFYNVLQFYLSCITLYSISCYTLLYSISLTIMHYLFYSVFLAVYVPTNGVYGFDTTMTVLILLYSYIIFSISINIIL